MNGTDNRRRQATAIRGGWAARIGEGRTEGAGCGGCLACVDGRGRLGLVVGGWCSAANGGDGVAIGQRKEGGSGLSVRQRK